MTQVAPRAALGIALGSGSARGWAHIGVLRALDAQGIRPRVVCGCSIGALVGAAYVSGHLDVLEDWVRGFTQREVMRYMDIQWPGGGGLIAGERVMDFLRGHIGGLRIQDLETRFAAVATDLQTGREVWLREGGLVDAVRASIALPALFTPVKRDDRWLVDGGLVNPVPVSLCKAMDARTVIAVNLNGDILGRRHGGKTEGKTAGKAGGEESVGIADQVKAGLRRHTDLLMARIWDSSKEAPDLFDVMAGAVNIMQDRITRSRMAGEPPDVTLMPRLGHLGLLEFHRAAEAIEEGRACVERMRPQLEHMLGR